MREGKPPIPDYESQPLTRNEYLTSVIHLYRGEMSRANTWRMRLDHTTNWAIIVTISAVSYTFGDVNHPHIILVISNYIILTLLWVEARRYRYYDVWRTRLRKIEENFFAPILRRDLLSPQDKWGSVVAEDFLHPKFKINLRHALKVRMLRNYGVLFAINLFGWLIELFLLAHDELIRIPGDGMLGSFYRAMAFHEIPPWLVLILQTAIYGYLLYLVILRVPHVYSGEIHEISPDQTFWDR